MQLAQALLPISEPLRNPSLTALEAPCARESFTQFARPHLAPLFRLCLTLADTREAAEDLLQNALVKAYLHRASFAGRGSAFGWLCGIVRHEWMEAVRTTARRRTLVRAAVERAELPDRDWLSSELRSDPEANAAHEEDVTALLDALRTLPEEHRTVLLLCDLEEMSHQEAAEALGIPIGTVKSRQARGRAQLKKALAQLQGP